MITVALTHGIRLGAYEVVAAIGAGGMGEVYRARDTTLHRDVALKVLPDAFLLDPDRFVSLIPRGGTTESGMPIASQFQIVLSWFEELRARVPLRP